MKNDADEIERHIADLEERLERIKKERDQYCRALNLIGMLGMSGLAYTSDYTEEVRGIVNAALDLDPWRP